MLNRRRLLMCSLVIACLGSSCDCAAPPANKIGAHLPGDSKFREVYFLADGLEVSHSPNPVRAQRGGRSGHAFTWQFRTTVSSPGDEVRITEFGSFSWDGSRWVFSNYTGKPFTTEDFAEWYSCPDGVLQPGQSYSDPENWFGSPALQGGRGLWYFVGVRADGKHIKGTAEIEELGELGSP